MTTQTVTASRIPNIVAVNVAVQCVKCGHVITGSPFWSIRKCAQLHSMSCRGNAFRLDEILGGFLK